MKNPDDAKSKKPKPGSRAAFFDSLQYRIESQGEMHDLPFKELRRKMIVKKYGEIGQSQTKNPK